MAELKLTPRMHLNMFGGSLGDPRRNTMDFVNISKPQGFKSLMSTVTVFSRFYVNPVPQTRGCEK